MPFAYSISILFLLCLSNNIAANAVLLLAAFACSLALIGRKESIPEKELAICAILCILALALIDVLRGSFESRAFFVESKIYLSIPLLSAARWNCQLSNSLDILKRSFATVFFTYSLFSLIASGFALRFSGYAPIPIFPITYASVCAFILLSSNNTFSKLIWSVFLFFSGSLSAVFGLGASILFKELLTGSRRSKGGPYLAELTARLTVISIIAVFSFIYIADVRGRDVFSIESLDRYMIYSSYLESLINDTSSNWLYLFIGYGSAGGAHFMEYLADATFYNWIQSFHGLYGNAVGYLLHSDYLRLFNLGGLFALAVFPYLLYKSITGCNGNFHSLKPGLQCILLFTAFQSIFNSVLYTSSIQIIFWVYARNSEWSLPSSDKPTNHLAPTNKFNQSV